MRTQQRKAKHRARSLLIRFLLALTISGILFNYLRPVPTASVALASKGAEAGAVSLAWPTQGSAALGAQGYGVLATHGSQTPRPTASLAKIITVLAVLQKHPLKLGQQGPSLTMTQADLDRFNTYFAEGGSYVKVELGEKITEYQALEAILLPSANNMADSLAVWSFGSMPKYIAYANAMLKQLGLQHTTAATDASGFSPDTKSTPSDLVTLGNLAYQNPVVAQIVAKPNAVIPVHGTIYSANARLGLQTVVGIKTGLTDQAGGCFLFAGTYTAGGKSVTVIGVIMGAPTLRAALVGSEPLFKSSKAYFSIKTPVKAGEVFATLTTAWMSSAQVVAKQDITLMAWKGMPLLPHIKLATINHSLPAGTQVGTAIISSGGNDATTPLVLQSNIQGPSWQWRMRRL